MGQREAPKPNLHVYGKDDTKIMIYNMRRWPKRRGLKKKKPRAKKIKKHITKGRTLDS